LLLLADADTGYGNAVNVYHTVRAFERAGVAGLMLEDQVWPKRCGHMKGKEVIPADRVASLPSAASLADLGIPNEETILWRALLAPKGTPPERVALLENAFEKAANSPAARKFLEDAGEQVAIKKGATLKRYIDAEYEAMGKLAKALNLAPQ
jgi:tripartite-type tricarboxylate transporter receptor subunit TctC